MDTRFPSWLVRRHIVHSICCGSCFAAACATLVVPFEQAWAQSNNQVRMAIVAGDNQSASPGTILPTPFTVRVTDELGLPYANAQVFFHEEDPYCMDAVPELPCPDRSELGSFVGGDISLSAYINTDDNGIAVAPQWILGSVPRVSVVANVTAMVPPYYFSYAQESSHTVRFSFSQSTLAVPALSPAMLAGLGTSLALMASWLLRRRVGG